MADNTNWSTNEFEVPVSINPKTLERDRSRLDKNIEVWVWLKDQGFKPEFLMDSFGVGLADVIRRAGDERRGFWLTAPVIAADGTMTKRIVKFNIPGISVNPLEHDFWCTGAARTYWDGDCSGKSWLLIVDTPRDVWRIAEVLAGTSLLARTAVISSTQWRSIPENWGNGFLKEWGRVLIATGNDAGGEAFAQSIRMLCAREFVRLDIPRMAGHDWIGYFIAGNNDGDFEKLVRDAHILGAPPPLVPETVPLELQKMGVYEADPVNVNGAFINGHMHYAFQVRCVGSLDRRVVGPDGKVYVEAVPTSFYETKVVRSDGVILGFVRPPLPRGVSKSNEVILLEDGTVISSIPKPRDCATWKLDSIKVYADAVAAGKRAHRATGILFKEVADYIRSSTWLPNKTDYELLTAYVLLSYCYDAFDAIPLILLNGEKGSGKSSLAEVIADLSYNAKILGGGSDRSFIRYMDQGRGLLVLDDLEAVGRRSQKSDNGYGDINQILKVSYSKSTGKKSIVEKDGSIRTLSFFGPKVLTNISGIDAVNATRTYRITCRTMPASIQQSGAIVGRDISISEPLRQELHAWGMSMIATIYGRYKRASGKRADRSVQISLPLYVIGEMTGDEEIQADLDRAIRRLTAGRDDKVTPEDIVKQACRECIKRGARETISMAQVRLEIAMISEACIFESEDVVPSELLSLRNPIGIGRVFRGCGVVSGKTNRARLNTVIESFYEIDRSFMGETLKGFAAAKVYIDLAYEGRDKTRKAFAFCERYATCSQCPYEAVCSLVLPAVNRKKC